MCSYIEVFVDDLATVVADLDEFRLFKMSNNNNNNKNNRNGPDRLKVQMILKEIIHVHTEILK